MANFVIQFPLKTEKWQEDILEKRFEIGRNMYNSLLEKTLKRYKELIKRRDYRELLELIAKSEDERDRKELYKKINILRKEAGFNEYAFHSEIKYMQKHFKENIDSFTAQKIATQLWKAYEELFYGKGKNVHIKSKEEFQTLEGKSNKTGITFNDGYLKWKNLKIKVEIDNKNYYEMEALKNDISYCRIIRKNIRGKLKYYLQIVFKGIAPRDIDKKSGELKERIGSGEVVIHLGKNIITYQKTGSDLKMVELADKVYPLELKRKELVERLKVEKNEKLREKLLEIYRKQSAIRKYQHECLANEILSLGDEIVVKEIENFQEWIYSIKREKMVKITKNSEIGNRAPKLFLTILKRKLKNYGKELKVLT